MYKDIESIRKRQEKDALLLPFIRNIYDIYATGAWPQQEPFTVPIKGHLSTTLLWVFPLCMF